MNQSYTAKERDYAGFLKSLPCIICKSLGFKQMGGSELHHITLNKEAVMETTKDLIPTNGVHITKSYYPAGWLVAKYDAEVFTSNGCWFETIEKAKAYAETL